MSSALQPDDPSTEQPFISHLVELRDRLIRMMIAVGLVVLVLFPFANDLYAFVASPLLAQLPEGNTMIATQVASPFLTPFKLALVSAIFLAMPYILFQLWGFVAPGLYQHEKRLAVPLLVSSILLFYLGMAFAYFVVFPLVFAFLSGTTPEGVEMMTDISAYLDFVLTLFFAFGIAFQIPIATILLVSVGIVTPEDLVRKRPYVIVGVFVIGMFLTPPDLISQTLLAIPMWMLFELGILFSRLILRWRQQTATDAPAPTPPDTNGGHPHPGGAATERQTSAPVATEIGRDLSPEIDEPDRWQPMTDEEMETELDLLDAEDAHLNKTTGSGPSADAPPAPARIDPVEDKILRANKLRSLDNAFAARQLLYDVLQEGDADQCRVVRNILLQMDEH